MFRLFYSKKATNQDILCSKLFDEANFYKSFMKDLRHARKSVVIESPFLTERRANLLASIFRKLKKRGVKIVIYTRSPGHHSYRLREQSMESIDILRDAGVTVYECYDYRHRKVAIIDKQTLWEGSLNILSQSRSRETMRRIVSPPLARQMLRIVRS